MGKESLKSLIKLQNSENNPVFAIFRNFHCLSPSSFCWRLLFEIGFVLLIGIIFSSCGKKDAEVRDKAIYQAKLYLTEKKCQAAIDSLESVGRYSTSAKYLQTLASAYACRAGYSAPEFWGTNLGKLEADVDKFFGSLTTFTTSKMTSSDDRKFLDLQIAIDLLLYAGGITSPSHSNRQEVFSISESQDINMQNLFMIITQMGKYFYFYGNVNPLTGAKGEGDATNGNHNGLGNSCLYGYDTSSDDLDTAILTVKSSNSAGACRTNSTSHPNLTSLPNALTVSRLCQGVILFNNLLDILLNVNIPNNGGSLKDLGDVIESFCTSNIYTQEICTIKKQLACEQNYAIAPSSDRLQAFFFFVFELNFK